MTAKAAFNPCSKKGPWFAGENTAGSSNLYEGISAHLIYRGDMLCTSYLGNDNYATTWSMVYGSDANGWSQTGQIYWYNIQNGCGHHFGQQEQNRTGYAPITVLGTCVSAGEVHQVWQQYLPSNGHERANIDQTVMLETAYIIWSNWARPLWTAVEGETGYEETDVPGTPDAVSDFSLMQVQRYSDDNWESTCYGNAVFYSNTNAWRYSDFQPGCDEIQVWTNNPNGY